MHRQLRHSAQHHGVNVLAVGGIADHLYMAVSVPPSLAVAVAVKRIKGASSRAIGIATHQPFAWQGDDGVDRFSERHLPTAVAYINNQHRHHAEHTIWSSIEEIPDPTDDDE